MGSRSLDVLRVHKDGLQLSDAGASTKLNRVGTQLSVGKTTG